MSDVSVDGLPASGVPFRVGDVLGKTFSVFGAKFGSFLLLALVPLLPVLLLNLMGPGGPRFGQPAAFGGLAGILNFVLGIVAQAMTLYAAFQEMAGKASSIGQSLGVGFGRFLPVLGVAIVSAICVGLASLLLVVPGIIVFCMFYVAVPVCVIEKPGVMESLGRSARLTKGYRWQIFGLLLLVGIVGGIAQFSLIFLVGTVSVWGRLLNFGWLVVATSFGAVLVAVAYHDLRMAKEGANIDSLASVFD